MARRLSDTTVEMGESQLLFALIDSPDSMILVHADDVVRRGANIAITLSWYVLA